MLGAFTKTLVVASRPHGCSNASVGLSRQIHIPMSFAYGPPYPRDADRIFGSALYFAVDKYEPDRTAAFMLKFLVVLWAVAAVLHCTCLFGYGFF
jgi:hypothetical protein